MTKESAQVILSNDAYNKIKWLTFNHDKEIGAIGTVYIRSRNNEKYFYVDKLFFPEQYTTGASIVTCPENWKNIVMTATDDEIGRMNFYWHKHPGSAGHSQGDEDDVFDTFMSPEGKLKYFIFLQTAKKYNDDKMDKEARIDLRHPIRTSIPHSCIKLNYELSPEEIKLNKIQMEKEKAVEKYCKKLIEQVTLDKMPISVKDRKEDGLLKQEDDKKSIELLFNGETDNDNDMLNGYATAIEEKASISFKDGAVKIIAGELFQKVIDNSIKEGNLNKYTGYIKTNKLYTTKVYILQPKKNCYENLKEETASLYNLFNKMILERMEDDNASKKTNVIEAPKETQTDYIYKIPNDSSYIHKLIGDLIIHKNIMIEWLKEKDKDVAKFRDIKDSSILGSLKLTDDHSNGVFIGKNLLDIIKSTSTYLLKHKIETV